MDFSTGWNADYIDAQFQLWKSDPGKVSRDWQIFFEGFSLAGLPGRETIGVCDRNELLLQSRVAELIYRYRDLGHLLACLDPLVACPMDHPLLNLAAFHLTEQDLNRKFYTDHLAGDGQATLRDILQALRDTYCHSIGVEYMHIQDPGERRWLQERMEPARNRPQLDRGDQLRILTKLFQSSLFEQFLHTKYLGQKRFSLEGAEAVIVLLDTLLQRAGEQGCEEIILGMAHRGRLNVLANFLGKPFDAVFCEFEDNYDAESLVGGGDVKYHKGYVAEVQTVSQRVLRVLLACNPSHLESVNPVVEGIARARQDQLESDSQRRVLPLLIHGDAAFPGQGVVFETLNLSQLEGYRTGGTVHIVINNQIGFTTLPEDARSTRYSTDVAKMLMVPIFHVHGEDPEALVHIIRLACDYRLEFARDVVVDVVCYRRHGHNEGDEPYYTQPQMYERIRERPPASRIYASRLLSEALVTEDDLKRMDEEIQQCLETAHQAAREKACRLPAAPFYANHREGCEASSIGHEHEETGVAEELLISLVRNLHRYPEGFSLHPKLQRIFDRRLETVEKGSGIDWGSAEMLAFASLLAEGIPLRLSGEDSRRGTFSHRHSVLVDAKTGAHYTPLEHLDAGQGRFSVYDSALSENAVLGFEYGYSLMETRGLTIWEAQFGDFANGAQVVIDEYIVGGESKWQLRSGLVLLLPHGYEGQGPDHSSARSERFLQLCAEDNIQVCNPSTPAQYFHLLRRQARCQSRKPLVILTPKSLLRHPLAVSRLDEIASGHFQEALDDPSAGNSVRRLLLCSGKIYYDLHERRRDLKTSDVAIIRLEQLYPFPAERLREILSISAQAREWFWVQEEPKNMGAWSFVQPHLQPLIGGELGYVGRPAAASPATGYLKLHKEQQAALVQQAFGV